MAFSSRELLLILRARDEASRVVRSFAGEFATVDAAAQRAARNQISAGSALVSVGVGIGAMGAATAAWLKGSTDLAVEFNKKIAYTATQLDNVKASQQDLANVIKTTGRDIAVPIEQLHDGLYDIFSSMNVNLPQANMLLRTFAKEAVAGQVELKEASRSTIGILNAFHLKVEDVTRVQDVQFQLVRKGVGTYEEFARVMGRATPSAARAGQSVEVLAGMLAYLTRNGLSAAMASASAGRAFDAFANPKTVGRLEKMGISVTDASGNFRKFTDVIVDLQDAFKDMTAPERAAALQDLFKGSGGTIQARRFYDAVLKDKTSVEQFVGLVGDMENAHGAFEQAYTTMSNTTASKSQLIANQWQLLRVEIGEALVPVLSKLMDILSAGLKWWNSLDEGLRRQIVTWVAIGAAIAVGLGIVLAMAGGFLMLAGAAAMMGISLGALLGIFAGVVVGLGAVIVAVVLLAKNWDSITRTLGDAWMWLWNTILKPIVDWFVEHIGGKVVALWNRVSGDIIDAVKTVGEWVTRIWNDIAEWTAKVWPGVQQVIQPFIDWFVSVWHYVSDALRAILRIIVDTFDAAWTIIVGILKGFWIAISGIFEGVIDILKGIIDFIVGVLTLNWEQAWSGIKEIVEGIWEIIKGVFVGAWEIIKGVFVGAFNFIMSVVVNGMQAIWHVIQVVLDGIGRLWNQFWDWVLALIGDILRFIADKINDFGTTIKVAFGIAVDHLETAWNRIQDIFATPVNFIIGIVYNKGIKWLWDKVADFLGLGHLPVINQLDHGMHFASGGPVHGPGGPRDDAIAAWLSNGEYVMPADKTRKYRPVLDAMRAGYDVIPGFADGGPIGKVLDWVGSATKEVTGILTDPIGYVAGKLGASKLVNDVAHVPFKLIGTIGERIWNMIKADQADPNSVTSRIIANGTLTNLLTGDFAGESAGMANSVLQAWGRQQVGKRYLWGAVGPNNYDCSGLVGNLWAIIAGKPLYHRYFTTASMGTGKFGMQRGPGNFTVYLNRQAGHTAANVGGLHMEAYNGNGTPMAIGRVGTPLSFYNEIMHVYKDGGFVDLKNNKEVQLASWLQRGWPEPTLFDNGGVWRHGTLGLNMSGQDEYVSTSSQMRDILGGAGSRGGDTYQTINITTQEIDPRKHGADLGWEITHGRVV